MYNTSNQISCLHISWFTFKLSSDPFSLTNCLAFNSCSWICRSELKSNGTCQINSQAVCDFDKLQYQECTENSFQNKIKLYC